MDISLYNGNNRVQTIKIYNVHVQDEYSVYTPVFEHYNLKKSIQVNFYFLNRYWIPIDGCEPTLSIC